MTDIKQTLLRELAELVYKYNRGAIDENTVWEDGHGVAGINSQMHKKLEQWFSHAFQKIEESTRKEVSESVKVRLGKKIDEAQKDDLLLYAKFLVDLQDMFIEEIDELQSAPEERT